MQLRFSPAGFILLMLGVLLIYARIPFLDVVGIVLFFAGLLLPVFQNTPIDVGQTSLSHLVVQQQENAALQGTAPSQLVTKATLFDTYLMLGAHIERAYNGDDLAIPWLIELSKNPDPQIRLSCARGFSYLPKYDSEVLSRLREMEVSDPRPEVREAARKPRERMEILRLEWEIGTH